MKTSKQTTNSLQGASTHTLNNNLEEQHHQHTTNIIDLKFLSLWGLC